MGISIFNSCVFSSHETSILILYWFCFLDLYELVEEMLAYRVNAARRAAFCGLGDRAVESNIRTF